jgi:hypothetical protein
MHMIPIYRTSMDMHFFAPRNLSQQFSTAQGNIALQNGIPVFGRPDQMILAIPNCVTSSFVFSHVG